MKYKICSFAYTEWDWNYIYVCMLECTRVLNKGLEIQLVLDVFRNVHFWKITVGWLLFSTLVPILIATPLGSLLDILKHMSTESVKGGFLDETVIATVLKEVLQGLEYFHNNGQIHRYNMGSHHLLFTIQCLWYVEMLRLVTFYWERMDQYNSQVCI